MTGLIFMSVLSIFYGHNDLKAQERSAFIADTTVSKALSSGWKKGAFTAVFFISGTGSNFPRGEWELALNPPFPHSISGLDDSYVQTALGISLLSMETKAGMSWLLKAALKDEIDAIMFLAISYTNNQEVKNLVEAERWFRKAIELGNQEAETKLNDMLAGKSINSSIKASNAYNFSFSQAKGKKR